MEPIVLASGSPRRRELLERLGVPFVVRVPAVEERVPADASPSEIVCALSRQKALAVEAGPDELVAAADTMVFLDGRAMGKPRDAAEALAMLTALQGRRHTVLTGVTVRRGDTVRTAAAETAVEFRRASREELLRYVATGEPLDKAGAYGIQGRGALLAERIEGDVYNVIGLPLALLGRLLAEFGYRIL